MPMELSASVAFGLGAALALVPALLLAKRQRSIAPAMIRPEVRTRTRDGRILFF